MKLGSQEEKSTALHLIKGTHSFPKASMKKYYCHIFPCTVIWRVWCLHSM